MSFAALFAQAEGKAVESTWLPSSVLAATIINTLVGPSSAVVVFGFLRLWVQCVMTGAGVGMFDLLGMKLRKVDYAMIVRQKIALVQANVPVTTRDLEAHFLSRGNVPKTATAVIAAHKAGIDLPWKTAAAIDLAGRDILDAVKTSVNPKVIDCPDPRKGKATLDGVCRNGIQLRLGAGDGPHRLTARGRASRKRSSLESARASSAIGAPSAHGPSCEPERHPQAVRQLPRFANGVRDRIDRRGRDRRGRQHWRHAAGEPGAGGSSGRSGACRETPRRRRGAGAGNARSR